MTTTTTGTTGITTTKAEAEAEPESEPETEPACTCTTVDGTTLTGSSGPATTQSLESLSEAADQATAALAKAREEIAAADAAIEAANGASSQLDAIDFSQFASTRFKRQASSITPYPVPTTCASVLTLMDDITDILANNPAGVTPLITTLVTIFTTALETPCTDDDIASLDSKKDAAKSTAEEAVAKQTNIKAAATEDYNAANEEILLQDAGGSTIAAGSAAPTVATMLVEPTTTSEGEPDTPLTLGMVEKIEKELERVLCPHHTQL